MKEKCEVPGFTYAWMIPFITRVARDHGYAIGVHGSMSRDLDLIAVPWIEWPSNPMTLLRAIAELTEGTLQPNAQRNPHGRLSYSITFKGAWHFIDISVMPQVRENV